MFRGLESHPFHAVEVFPMRYPALTILTVIFVSVSLATGVSAQGKKAAAKQPPAPTPTEAAVSYGPHPKQVLSFWKVESEKPTP